MTRFGPSAHCQQDWADRLRGPIQSAMQAAEPSPEVPDNFAELDDLIAKAAIDVERHGVYAMALRGRAQVLHAEATASVKAYQPLDVQR